MIRFAFRNLLTRPLRSLLALVGLTVAIAGMVGLFSVAEGLNDTVSRTFGKIPGLAVMQPGAPIPLFSRLPASWGAEIAKLRGVHIVHPEVWTRAHVIDGEPCITPPRFLFGIDIDQTLRLRRGVYRGALTRGRFLEPSDKGTSNCLISESISEEYHKGVGNTFRVDGTEMTIVGVYRTGSLLLDVAILADAPLIRDLGRMNADTVCVFYVEPETDADRERLKGEIKDLFRGRSPGAWEPASALDTELEAAAPNPVARFFLSLAKLSGALSLKRTTGVRKSQADVAGDELPVEVRSADDWAEQFEKFRGDLDIFLSVLTAIGVTIAVLGIVNTMLMSVTERFIEFGILKANGWSSRDVLLLIGWESALLGIGGGVVGSLAGWIATHAINGHWPDRIHLYASPQLLVFSLVFSTVVGLLGGLYPAVWASRMMPMDAIRRG